MGLDYIVYNMVYWGWRDIIITSVSLGPRVRVHITGIGLAPLHDVSPRPQGGFFYAPGNRPGVTIGGGCVRPSTIIITGQVWPSRCSAWARRDIAALWMSRPSPSAGGGIPVLLVLAIVIMTIVGAGGARISPEDYWRPCGRGACGSSVWTVVHAMTCRPHPSVYDRPTDRYTLAALALCGGLP